MVNFRANIKKHTVLHVKIKRGEKLRVKKMAVKMINEIICLQYITFAVYCLLGDEYLIQ